MTKKYSDKEVDDALRQWFADTSESKEEAAEKYALWTENKEEYLEVFKPMVSEMCKNDRKLVEGIVMELQNVLNEMHELLEKPGWEALCYEIELRNFQSELLDGSFQKTPTGFYEFPTMGDKEMAKVTGLSRERIVQETKRCARKIGNKMPPQLRAQFIECCRDIADRHSQQKDNDVWG